VSKSKTAREARDQKSPNGNTADGLEQKVLEFAEQLGWLVGTVNARSEGWLDRKALGAQVGRIRDGAVQLMGQLTSEGSPKARRQNASRASKRLCTAGVDSDPADLRSSRRLPVAFRG